MPVATQETVKERVFDASGETVEEFDVPQDEGGAEEPASDPETQDIEPDAEPASETTEPGTGGPAHKYRIGDKTFATQAEALSYAEGQVASTTEVDAYRQVLREAIAQVPRQESVTPAQKPAMNTEELYTNPEEFLTKFAKQVKTETLSEFNQSQAQLDADNRVWSDFSTRHPDLTDFRQEITELVGRIQPEVQAVGRSKGSVAAYDYVATKFKAHIERINAALKPRRELKNGSGGAPAGGKVQTVMPKSTEKKPLSMAEQIRSLKKRR